MNAKRSYLCVLLAHLLLAPVFFISMLQNASAQTVQYTRQFDGYGLEDRIVDAATDANNNLYVAGWTKTSSTNTDYIIIKYNANGDRKWVRTYNPGLIDKPTSISVGGGYVYVTGTTQVSGSNKDFATMKIDTTAGADATGWPQTWGTTGSLNDTAVAVRADANGNVFVAGTTFSSSTNADYRILKYASTGGSPSLVVLKDVLGLSLPDTLTDMTIDNRNYVIVTGASFRTSFGSDYVTVCYNNSLVEQWTARYSNSNDSNGNDRPIKILASSSQFYYVTGISYSGNTTDNNDIATVKYNSSGTQSWAVRQNEAVYNRDEIVVDMTIDANSNLYLTGTVGWPAGSGGAHGLTAFKYDSAGTRQWYRRIGGNGAPLWPKKIRFDGSTYTYVGGDGSCTCNSGGEDFLLIKYDATGAVVPSPVYDGNLWGGEDSLYAMAGNSLGYLAIAGFTTTSTLLGSPNNRDMYLVTLNVGGTFISQAAFVATGPAASNTPGSYTLSQNYPNPFNPSTRINFSLLKRGTVSLKIYDMLGREVTTLINNQDLSAGDHSVQFNAADYSSGVYYYRIIAGEGVFHDVKKMILVK